MAAAKSRTKMVLFGGEWDGWEVDMSAEDRPDVYYAVPYHEEGKISACKSSRARLELRSKLAVMAYEFSPEKSTDTRYRMYRCPSRDRVSQD